MLLTDIASEDSNAMTRRERLMLINVIARVKRAIIEFQ